MAGRNRRRCRMSRRVSHPAKAISIRAPPSAKAPVRSRVPRRAATQKPNGLNGTFEGNGVPRNSPQSRAAEVRRRCRTLRPVSRFVGRGGIPAPAGGKIDCPELCGATCKRTEAAILRT